MSSVVQCTRTWNRINRYDVRKHSQLLSVIEFLSGESAAGESVDKLVIVLLVRKFKLCLIGPNDHIN